MDPIRLRNFAKLIARKGVNVQKGQQVIIQAELDQPEFVAMLVEECYLAGAGMSPTATSRRCAALKNGKRPRCSTMSTICLPVSGWNQKIRTG